MSEIHDYRIDIVARTRELLTSDLCRFEEKKREVTFLVNCLLGLVVAVSNHLESNQLSLGMIDSEFVRIVPSKFGFLQKGQKLTDFTFCELTDETTPVGHRQDLLNQRKEWFIKKLRNGIAHQHIYGLNANKKWIGVKIWNERKPGQKDFEVLISTDELRRLALKIADDFIEATPLPPQTLLRGHSGDS